MFSIVRPCRTECRPSRFHDCRAGRILNLGGVGRILLDVHHGCPATVGRMLQMLRNWIVIFLPPIKGSFTEKAGRVIGVGVIGFVIEACVCQLRSRGQFLLSKGAQCDYLCWRRSSMRPCYLRDPPRTGRPRVRVRQDGVEARQTGGERVHSVTHKSSNTMWR
jgi:hypothetical protein